MKSRRGFTATGFAAASGAVMMLLSTTAGTVSQTKLQATHARATADVAAWGGLRVLREALTAADRVAATPDGSQLTVAAAEPLRYYVADGRLYEEAANGSRRVLQQDLEAVRFEVDGRFVTFQVISRQTSGRETYVVTRGSEVRL